MLGQPCARDDARACADRASRYPLLCENGVWTSAGQCTWTERCVTKGEHIGTCRPALDECLGGEPGDWFCSGEATRLRCGVDLLDTDQTETCLLGCVDGACRECAGEAPAPTCSHNGLLTCSEAGTWVATPCPEATPHCSAGVCGVPPSCVGGPSTCGTGLAGMGQTCCTSPLLPPGSFARDGISDRPATIQSFRLDRFEVANIRFNRFVSAWNQGWRPAPGAGKHTHLRDGAGLMLREDTYETGWDTAWTAEVDVSAEARTGDGSSFATTTDALPVNFVNFYEAYAFCIWDGGFLPSAAEWAYVASGGNEQLTFPWGDELAGTDNRRAVYDCLRTSGLCQDATSIGPVGSASVAGWFGHYDLAGNVAERVQGGLTTAGTCVDCLELPTTPSPTVDQVRGGAFDSDAGELRNDAVPPTMSRSARSAQAGFRCARAP